MKPIVKNTTIKNENNSGKSLICKIFLGKLKKKIFTAIFIAISFEFSQ